MSTYTSVNPADLDDAVLTVELATPDRFVEACREAGTAQRAWSAVPAPVRGRVIAAIGRLVEANAEALARLVTREVGKPLAEARGEVQEVIDTCDFFLGEGRRLYGQTVPSEMPDKQLFTFRVPVGTAVVITAGNFPVAVPSWYLVPALLRRQRRGLEARGVRGRLRAGHGRALHRRRPAARAAHRRPRRRRRPPSAASRPRCRPGWSTRSGSPDRPTSAARSASCAGGTCRRRAWSWAARTRWW